MSSSEFSIFFVEEIKRNCQMIEERIQEHAMTHESYAVSPEFQDLLAMPMLRICELVKKYRSDLEDAYPDYAWKDVAGMRDKIAHPYGGFDFEFIWDASQEDLDALLAACDAIIEADNA